MKTNHQKFLDTIKSLNSKPSLLLHVCCAPCLAGVIERIYPYFKLTLYYFNPNIMPKEEYEKRFLEIDKLLKGLCLTDIEIIKADYDNTDFLGFAYNLKDEKEGSVRCKACISYRLTATAKIARKNHFDYFASTLSVSPHKDAEFINIVGENLSKEYDIRWLYNDFKKDNGFLKSTKLSKELELYRQDYCGCKFE